MSSLSSYQSQNLVFGGDMVLGVVVRSTDCPLMPFYCRLWCPWMLSTSIREDLINFDVLLCEPDPPLRVGGAISAPFLSFGGRGSRHGPERVREAG